MRRDREVIDVGDFDDGDGSTVAAAAAPQQQQQQPQRQQRAPHPVLTRPALLSHIFKFVARDRKDVRLLLVHSAWEDTAVNFCPWMWQRLLLKHGRCLQPQLGAASSVEEMSQQLFNDFTCRVWSRGRPNIRPLLARLVNPVVVDLSFAETPCDASVFEIFTLAAVQELNVAGWWRTAAEIAFAGALLKLTSSLHTLRVTVCHGLGDAFLMRISRLTALHTLAVEHGSDEITDGGVAYLANLPLTNLNLGGLKRLSAASIAHIAQLQNLQVLKLRSCINITNCVEPAQGNRHIGQRDGRQLGQLGKLTALQHLDLRSCGLIEADLRRLVRLRDLRELDLSFNHHLTFNGQLGDRYVRHICKVVKLERLTLRGCTITDADLDLLSALPALEMLDLCDCRGMTQRAIDSFCSARSACVVTT